MSFSYGTAVPRQDPQDQEGRVQRELETPLRGGRTSPVPDARAIAPEVDPLARELRARVGRIQVSTQAHGKTFRVSLFL